MQRIVFAAALLLGAAPAANADAIFKGRLVTTEVTDCAYTRRGDTRASEFRPPAVAGNPGGGGLTMMNVDGGYAVQFSQAIAVNTDIEVNSVEVGGFGFAVYKTKMRFTKVDPTPGAAITEKTDSVYLEGTISEPFGEKFSPGKCVVEFRAALVRRID